MENDTLMTHRADHLPMVAQFIDDIGMIKIIDDIVGVHPNEILTTGQAAASMVIMALGFVSRPAYLSPQFFESKALKLILGPSKTDKTIEILPEHLNDDKLGRTLDEIYDLGPDTLFQTIAFAAARLEKLTVPTLHLDTTSHSFYGNYEGNLAAGVNGRADSWEPCHAEIVYGFSKDHRNDCKQLVQELWVTGDGDVPLMVKIHSGNEADTKIFQERVKELKQQFKDATDLMPEFIVADSKFYNETNIIACQNDSPKWITRVPDNITEAKNAFFDAYIADDWNISSTGKGTDQVRNKEFILERCGVKQRFIIVVSDPSLRRAEKTIDRQSKAELKQLEKAIKKLSKTGFASSIDAESAAKVIFEKMRYHSLGKIDTSSIKKHIGKGRPREGAEVEIVFYVTPAIIALTELEVIKIRWHKASFIIGTNDLTSPAQKIIDIYRKDQQGVERAFRFLKSPTYFADAFFFKNTKRIVALLTLMTISLLVYSLLQRKLRIAIEANNEPIPDQKGKPTKRPTINWVNQCFEGIDLISQSNGDKTRYVFIRLGSFAKQVLNLLGPNYVSRYSVEMLV
jgi:transposase